jgi:hypothetical protein
LSVDEEITERLDTSGPRMPGWDVVNIVFGIMREDFDIVWSGDDEHGVEVDLEIEFHLDPEPIS